MAQTSKKCANCRLINFAAAPKCIRCSSAQFEIVTIPPNGGFLNSNYAKRLGLLAYAFVFAFAGFYISMVLSAQPLKKNEAASVEQAISVIADKGFSTEAFMLRHLTSFRSSDNWLNASIPKENAYAATNFPFEVMTLYPDFFKYPVDDVERAVILLHEARHLQGRGEEDAYEFVWRNRQRFGWTKDKYQHTDLWTVVRLQTQEYAPALFTCPERPDHDCTEERSAANGLQRFDRGGEQVIAIGDHAKDAARRKGRTLILRQKSH